MNQQKKNPNQKNIDDFRKLTTTSYQPGDITAVTARQPILERKQTKLGSGRRSWKKIVLLAFLILLLPFLVIGIWNLHNFSTASTKLFGSNNVVNLLFPTPLKDVGGGRTNILLVGNSRDNPGHGGADLTDSILVLSLDKQTDTGYMLSIPRDLFLTIPGYKSARINEAFQAGESFSFKEPDYWPGGVGLLQKIITENLGLELHYYAIINYASVRQTVDALGGVTVTIDSPDSRGLYDPNFQPHEGGPLRLENGPQEIDGLAALRLTRARGVGFGSYGFPQSDFNRTENQRRVLTAIKDEISWTLILNPRKNGQIFGAFADNIETNVKISEVLSLFRLFNRAPTEELNSVGLNSIDSQDLLVSYTDFSNGSAASVQIPRAGLDNFSEIRAAISELNK
jgi:LCP family protein required for cell wall assembly